MTLSRDYQRPWAAYYDAVSHQGPRDTLLRALTFFDQSHPKASRTMPTAIDIACGEGRDTRELLRNGWKVYAFDASDVGMSRLKASLAALPADNLHCSALTFEGALADLRQPSGFFPPAVDLLNASFALPFCEPAIFPDFWTRITQRLVAGGLFCGQVFGERDSWATIRPQSHYTREGMLELFTGFDMLWLEEVEKDGADALGGEKHHHLFHVVARKR
jgi:tellurite methyltransferase